MIFKPFDLVSFKVSIMRDRTSPLPDPSAWIGISYGLAAAAIWGAWPVASRFGVQQTLGAEDLAAIRFLVAGLILLPLVLKRGHGGLGWGRAAVLAIGAGAPYALVTMAGLTLAPAGHAGLIIPSAMLTCATLGGWFLLGDRPDGRRVLGLLLILSGVLCIGSVAMTLNVGGLGLGHGLFIAGGMLWALYTVMSRKWGVDPLHATALVSVLSMLIYGPVYVAVQGIGIVFAPIEELLFQALAQGVFSAILALVFYTKAVTILGAGRGALFAALVPGLSAVFAYPALGEVPSGPHIVGLCLATAGMALALRRKR